MLKKSKSNCISEEKMATLKEKEKAKKRAKKQKQKAFLKKHNIDNEKLKGIKKVIKKSANKAEKAKKSANKAEKAKKSANKAKKAKKSAKKESDKIKREREMNKKNIIKVISDIEKMLEKHNLSAMDLIKIINERKKKEEEWMDGKKFSLLFNYCVYIIVTILLLEKKRKNTS